MRRRPPSAADGRGAGLGCDQVQLPTGRIPDQLADHVVGLAHRLLHRQPHQQSPHLGWRAVDGLVEVVGVHQRRKAARCRSSENSAASSRSPTSSGRWMASRSASSPGLNSPADRPGPDDPAARRPPPDPPADRSTPASDRSKRSSPSSGSRTQDPSGTPSRLRRWPVGCRPAGLSPISRNRSRPRSHLPEVLETLAQERRLEPAALGHLHQVVVANQVVGVLGHRGQRVVGGPGPTLRGGQVGGVEDPLQAELEERLGVLDGCPKGIGVAAGPRSRGRSREAGRPPPRRSRSDAPTRRSGRLRPVRRRRRRRPAPPAMAKLRSSFTCSSARAVPQVATARSTPASNNPMTSVYPSHTTTSPDSMMSCLAQLSA